MSLSQPSPDESGATEATRVAVGLLTEALETCERARGHLYTFHQLTGSADIQLGQAIEALRRAGHDRLAGVLENELLGRNVIADRWTYQIVEDYDDTYWAAFRGWEQQVRHDLVGGRRNLSEAEMKQRRRTHGHPHHTPAPNNEDT